MNMESFLQMNTIFISILIEALPFILIGVLISGTIQMFVTEQMMARLIPKNRFLSVLFASVIGALFPACECGIVPITKRLMTKGVPLHAAIAFMLTGPVINPIVLFSTYIAFGNSWKMVFYRGGLAFIVAIIVGFILAAQFKTSQLKNDDSIQMKSLSLKARFIGMLKHSIDEFFSVGKFLIFGAFIAASVQTYVKTSMLLDIGNGFVSSHLVMMGLAYVLSLCSEADAFVAASFRSSFSTGSLVAFLVFGPMLDIKNTVMLLGTFKAKFVLYLTLYISVTVLVVTLFV
ncbi:permease [Bacillus sp. 03113]|uniref:permease n=1 Tax=Bacillus sp. 03113 TaxID=2578211 RepID=UPI001141D083|nr:permease [Bacillus sp. 03113]